MKLTGLIVFCALMWVAFAGPSHADDFNDEPAAHNSDPSAPPSASEEYNKDLTDAAGQEKPKTPEPESAAPAAERPAPSRAIAPHAKAKSKKSTAKTKKSAAKKSKKSAKKKKSKKKKSVVQ